MLIRKVAISVLGDANREAADVYSTGTWTTLRAAATADSGDHRQHLLPLDIREIRRIVDEIDHAIRVFDAYSNGQLNSAIEIEQALCNSNLQVEPAVLPNCQGRIDMIELYLTDAEFAEFRHGKLVLRELVGLAKQVLHLFGGGAAAVVLAKLFRMMAAVIRFGTISTLHDLYLRVALVHDVLARNQADLGQKRRRGRPTDAAVAARDLRLWEIADWMVAHGRRPTEASLFALAKNDPTVIELERFGLKPLTPGICRGALRATSDKKRRSRQYLIPDPTNCEDSSQRKASVATNLHLLEKIIAKGK